MFRFEKIKQFNYVAVVYSSNEVRTLLYGDEPIAHAAFGSCWVKSSLNQIDSNPDSESSKCVKWFLKTFKYMWDHNDERIIYGNYGGREAIDKLSISL